MSKLMLLDDDRPADWLWASPPRTRATPRASAWPAPPHVQAVTTSRWGGSSRGPYAGLNLAMHVGDDPACVQANRQRLRRLLELPAEPCWLNQVHGAQVIDAAHHTEGAEADAAYTLNPGVVLAALTADCLPVLLCDQAGTRIGIAHAGWRGLAAGVLEALVAALGGKPDRLLAWLGPAIGPQAFEVGPEVRAAFVERDPKAACAFRPAARSWHWHADLYALARLRLGQAGVTAVYGGGQCTLSDPRYYSFRRDRATGRMASLIWISQKGRVT